MEKLIIDNEFRDLFPSDADERKQLEANLLDSGCLDSIKTWGSVIVDGHNRYEICQKHGIAFEVTRLEFEDRDHALLWIYHNQFGRRNITAEKRAYAIGQASIISQRLRLNPPQVADTLSAPPLQEEGTVSEIAESWGVSDREVRRSTEFAKAVDALEEAIPGSKDEILSGKASSKKKVVEAAKSAKSNPAVAKAILEGEAPGPVPTSLAPLTPQEEQDKLVADSMPVASGIKECRDRLVAIKKYVNATASIPGGELLAAAKSRIIADIDNLDRELRFAAPYAVCPYCNSKLPNVLSCAGCGNRGWVNETVYKSAPDNPNPESAQLSKLKALGNMI